MNSTGGEEQTGTIAIGSSALTALTTGASNTAVGYNALLTEDAGGSNTAIGYQSLKICNNDSGGNTAVGKDTLVAVVAGYSNTAVGLGAGSSLVGGVSNVLIGRNAQASATGGANQVVIGGVDTTGVADNSVTLGNASVTKVYCSQGADAKVYLGNIEFTSDDASGNANTLDDYEEGSWTGVVTDGSNAMTMVATTGYYTKVGNLVTVSGYFTTNSLGSASGSIRMTGLPFTVANNAAAYSGGGAPLGGGYAITLGHYVSYYAEINTTYLYLNVWDATTGMTGMQHSEWTADGQIIISFSYRAA